ncbi:hypothetical protein B296_00015291 [Ensete ventricosum]|uniref:Uncharacterized protein n=1 Tax=Ensete ventricosum TaxID=4639 RepID=A0A426YRA5_ENSVE|nr:hypothetical protein B296_00015291 [Ensete ventricosum]
MGGCPCGRAWAAGPCSMAAGDCPCDRAMGSRPLRPGRWRQFLAGWPQPFMPAGLLPLRVVAPCKGPGRRRSPLQGGWS